MMQAAHGGFHSRHRAQLGKKFSLLSVFVKCLVIFLTLIAQPIGLLCRQDAPDLDWQCSSLVTRLTWNVQFETLAGFTAVIDRLGEFMEILDETAPADSSAAAPLESQAEPLLPPASSIQLTDEWHEGDAGGRGGGACHMIRSC